MKNNLFSKISKIFLFLFLFISTSESDEAFTFDVKEIEIIENGNIFIGKNGGTAKSGNGITIYGKNFKYDKENNILYSDTNVRIEDKIKNITIFTDKITYLKNKEIIFTENKSKAIYEKIIIEANNFKYNKISNTINAEGNVKINDQINKYSSLAKEITYFISDDKIVSKGETDVFIKSKYKFFGSNLTIFRNLNKFSSKNKSKLIDNTLTQYEFDEFIYFFEDELLKAKNIVITSNNSLPEGKNDKAKFLDGFFDLKNKNFTASKTTVKIKKNSFDNSENDPRIMGVSSESKNGITKINKAVFTSCKLEKDKCPPWSIQAEKITHDKNKKQLIYDQAILRIYDKPVMYFPKFFHPDPSVERQSGFIRPQLNNSEILGTSIYIPYFHVISENKDLTIKPTIFEDNIQMYQGEYRQENQRSSFIADFNFVKGYESSSLKKKSSLTHLFSKYDLNLNLKDYVNSLFSFFIEKTNNDTYLKVFDTNLIDMNKLIKPESNSTLHSGMKIELDKENFNFLAGMDMYENLSVGRTNDKYQHILPYYNFSTNLGYFNYGSVDFLSSGSNKLSNTNNLRSQIINNFNYSTFDIYSKNGFRNDVNIFFKNLNTVGKNDTKYKSRPSMAVSSIFEVNSSIPLKKINKNSNEFLEPKISFRFNPGDMKNYNSDKRIINTDNIFDINRIGVNDTFEAGKSLTLGLDYKKEYNIKNKNLNTQDVNDFFEFKLATSIRDEVENYLPTSTTLNKKYSNLFGSIKNHYFADTEKSLVDSLKVDYYFSLNNGLNDLEYNSLNGELVFNDFTTSIKFIEENGPVGNSNVMENSFSYKFDDLNHLSFKTRRNRKINLTEYYDLMYEYKNDCLTAGIKYKKTYYQDRDLKPTEDLMLSFTFYPLTTYEQEIDQSLYRN